MILIEAAERDKLTKLRRSLTPSYGHVFHILLESSM